MSSIAETFLSQLPDLLLKAQLYPLVSILLPAAHDDQDKAWASARQAVLLYDPQTEVEFRLAVRTAVFSIQATQAAARASTPGLPMAAIARQQAHAVSMAREADKAERRLEKVQKARRQSEESQDPEEPPETKASPKAEQPLELKDEIQLVKEYARKNKIPFAQLWSKYLLARRDLTQAAHKALPPDLLAASPLATT